MSKSSQIKLPEKPTAKTVVPVISQEVLNDLSRENALIHESDEKATEPQSDEMYDFFWFISLSIRTVVIHFSIFLTFFDAFNIVMAQRDSILKFQWLYTITVFGPMCLLFGVSADVYYNLTFLIAYLTSGARLIINGCLAYHYYISTVEIQKELKEYECTLEKIQNGSKLPENGERPSFSDTRTRNLFRSDYSLIVLMVMCIVMALVQIWALAVAIPRSQIWSKKKKATAS